MRALAAGTAAALALLGTGTASAAEVSRAELRALAERARSDPAALERVREVDAVEGRPVDVGAALAGADGSDLDERLRLLAGGARSSGAPTGAAREDAREVLAERRFHPADGVRPLRGVLEWLSRGVAPIVEAIGDFFDGLASIVPGGDLVLWLIAALLVAALAVLLARRAIRNRAAREGPEPRAAAEPARPDPRRLERDADAAERRGDLALAIRLRFHAGLLRLDRAQRIAFRESMTSGEVSRRLRSRDFDLVAATFDEIVYGGRRPATEDVAGSREGWRRVLAEARP